MASNPYDRFTGLNQWIAWQAPNGMYILSDLATDFTVNHSADDEDASAGNSPYKWHVAKREDMTVSLALVEHGGTVVDAYELTPRTAGTIWWGPRGSASGYPCHAIAAYVTKADHKYPYDGLVTVDVEMQGRGTMVRDWAGTFE